MVFERPDGSRTPAVLELSGHLLVSALADDGGAAGHGHGIGLC